MADLSITATSVVPGTDARTVIGIMGEPFTLMQTVYKKAADGKWYKADADAGTQEAREPDGVAVSVGNAGGPCVLQTGGSLATGATLTKGTSYYQSKTAGGICPIADVSGTGTEPSIVMTAIDTSNAKLVLNPSGVTL